jgi:hypothetical protein
MGGSLMLAAALHGFDWQRLRLSKHEVVRMLVAGIAWGVTMSAGLAAMTWWNCAMICPDYVALTTAVSVTAGILTIGPITAYAAR